MCLWPWLPIRRWVCAVADPVLSVAPPPATPSLVSPPQSQRDSITLAALTANVACIPVAPEYAQNVASLSELQDRLPYLPYDIVAMQEIFESLTPTSDPELIRLARDSQYSNRFRALWRLFASSGGRLSFSTHKRQPIAGYHGFGTASRYSPLVLDAGLMTYSRRPFVSKEFVRFRDQTDAIVRGALFCVIALTELPHAPKILHINAHLSPSHASDADWKRLQQIDQICDHVLDAYPSLVGRIILTGDLNIEYSASTRPQQLDVALCDRLGLHTLWTHLPRRSFVGYHPADPRSELVDYILVSQDLGEVIDIRAIERGEGAFGDHLPVAAIIRITI